MSAAGTFFVPVCSRLGISVVGGPAQAPCNCGGGLATSVMQCASPVGPVTPDCGGAGCDPVEFNGATAIQMTGDDGSLTFHDVGDPSGDFQTSCERECAVTSCDNPDGGGVVPPELTNVPLAPC